MTSPPSPDTAKNNPLRKPILHRLAQRLRGQVANSSALKAVVTPLAIAAFSNSMARRVLETPDWQSAGRTARGLSLAIDCTEIPLPGAPFAMAPTSDGRAIFVSVQVPGANERRPGLIAVLQRDTDSLRLTHNIPLSAAPWGLQLLRDDGLLAVANSHGVAVLDAMAARDPAAVPEITEQHYGQDYYTMQVLASADGRHLFASDEHNNTVTILDIDKALARGASGDAVVGEIPVDVAPVSMVLSADGRQLFVTCEMRRIRAPDLVNWLVFAATLKGGLRRGGTVCTIDLDRALRDPARGVVARTPAGGNPVRLVMSQDGRSFFVSARANNQVLAFDAGDPRKPTRRAAAPVGPSPVGIALLDELGVLLVANSDRFQTADQPQTVSVLDLEDFFVGRPASLGEIPVGVFPREICVDHRSDTVYVTNFGSQSLTTFSIATLATAVGAVRKTRKHQE